jgi:hypothetical protein
MMTTPFSKPAAATSSEALAGAGFTPMSGGSYARGEFRLTIGAHWCVFEAPESAMAPGVPGLWKRVGAAGAARLIFALPRRIWDDAASTDTSFDGEITVLQQCLQWALDAAQDSVPPEWQAPSRALVESWFKPEQLTVVAGSLLRQGEVICESDQLAIRFPLVPELPSDLPESRLAWLRTLITEAQERWHLVRVEVLTGADGQSNAVAEVDLTGAPHEIAEDLFVLSLEALRWVVQWLGETTDWLADATVASELLAVCPDQQP